MRCWLVVLFLALTSLSSDVRLVWTCFASQTETTIKRQQSKQSNRNRDKKKHITRNKRATIVTTTMTTITIAIMVRIMVLRKSVLSKYHRCRFHSVFSSVIPLHDLQIYTRNSSAHVEEYLHREMMLSFYSVGPESCFNNSSKHPNKQPSNNNQQPTNKQTTNKQQKHNK